jgi:arylsulfatase A-like enzyme
LLEDGRELGPAHSPHEDVREQGSGRYSHWKGRLFFSTSDGSDPNTNGRSYAIDFDAALDLGRYGYDPLPVAQPFAELEANTTGPVTQPGGAARADAPRVVYWFTIDALRSDVPDARIDGVAVMPALAAFAAEAVTFGSAYAPSSNTKLSTASMFTGLWPQRHGVMGGVLHVWPEGGTLFFGLDPRFVTLAELFRDAGFETLTHRYSVHVQPGGGLLQGFDRVDLDVRTELPFTQTELPERLFVYEHILGLHAPYRPSEAARAHVGLAPARHLEPGGDSWPSGKLSDVQVRELWDAYLAEGFDADRLFERRMRWLRDRGLYDDALVIVTADHGEQFVEHGTTQHSGDLYEEVVHVPLFIKFPADSRFSGLHGRTLPNRVSLVDLYPSLAEWVSDAPLPYQVDGRSLTPILDGEETDPLARDVLIRHAQNLSRPGQPRKGGQFLYVTDAVLSGRWKALLGYRLYRSRDRDRWPFERGDWIAELYDMTEDPSEQRNLAPERPDDFLRLAGKGHAAVRPLLPLGASDSSAVSGEVDEDLLERLRQLGYLE